MTSRALLRGAGYYSVRPLELADLLHNEWERRTESSEPSPVVGSGASATEMVHRLLGLPERCEVCDGFDSVWGDLRRRFPGDRSDQGADVLRAEWAAVRHLSASVVVETGVARGFSSAVILSALVAQGKGHLWSVDLPEFDMVRNGEAGSAVTTRMSTRWSWIKGGSRRLLPRLLRQQAPIDVFVHDSLHTRANMLFEMDLAWDALRPGGLLLVDDVDHNSAFAEFVHGRDARWARSGRGDESGDFGAVLKPL